MDTLLFLMLGGAGLEKESGRGTQSKPFLQNKVLRLFKILCRLRIMQITDAGQRSGAQDVSNKHDGISTHPPNGWDYRIDEDWSNHHEMIQLC